MTRNNKISVYTRSGESAPAGYYRIIQYLKKIDNFNFFYRPLLKDHQFTAYLNRKPRTRAKKGVIELYYYLIIIARVTYFLIRDIMSPPKVIILSRVFVPRMLPFHIKFLVDILLRKSVLIWDFDDHILENKQVSKRIFDYLCKKSKHIIVIHDFLKNLIPDQFQEKVILLPTTDGDMFHYQKNSDLLSFRQRLFEKELHLVWVATSGNIPYLEYIIPTLDKTAAMLKNRQQKKLVLNVVCNIPIEKETTHLFINNIRWSREAAIQAMKNSHVGLMPLIDSVFAKGKGAFKLIQYISIGLPVLASKVGYNTEVVDSTCGYLVEDSSSPNEWEKSLLEMASDWTKYEQLSNGAFNKWKMKYSFKKNHKVWEKLIHNS